MTDAIETIDAEISTEVEAVSGAYVSVEHDIATMNEGAIALYSSIDMTDFDGALEVAEALGNSTPLEQFYGQEFDLANVVVQKVSIPNVKTGEVNDAPRVTLIAADGRIFHATSVGVFSSVRNLFGMIGEPSAWPNGFVTVKAVQERTRSGFNVTVLKVVRKSGKK